MLSSLKAWSFRQRDGAPPEHLLPFRLATDLKAAATLSPDGRVCAAACTPCRCQHRVARACRGPLWLGRSKIMPRAGVVSTQRSQTQPRTDDLSSWQDKSSVKSLIFFLLFFFIVLRRFLLYIKFRHISNYLQCLLYTAPCWMIYLQRCFNSWNMTQGTTVWHSRIKFK